MESLAVQFESGICDLNESARLFHGRGHCCPGYEDLLIDWYAPIVLVTLYRRRTEEWLTRLVELLRTRIPVLDAVVLQQRYLPQSPGRLLFGRLPETVYAVEKGLKYKLHLNRAQNIGFFPDMAAARSYVRDRAAGKKILNLFAYSCSFSVAAVAGGARQTVNLDMNRAALALGKMNHRLNGQDMRKVAFLGMELFRSFSRLKKLAPFDQVICDPPAEQGRNFQAERDWPKLVRKLPALLNPGGEILACISSPHLSAADIHGLFAEYAPAAVHVKTLRAGQGFPERDPDKGTRTLIYRCG